MAELNLVLLGPPGSGKGTQGERLNEDLHLPYYATGDILRAAVRDETELGRTAKQYMESGDLVPDGVIVGVVAEALDAKLQELGRGVTAVLLIDVSDDEVVRRLGGRRTCAANGHVFHLDFNPPEREGICDIDGSELTVRDDDKPEVIRKRLQTYHEKTEPLVVYYDRRSVLRRIAGEAPPDEVTEEVRRTLATMRLEQDETV